MCFEVWECAAELSEAAAVEEDWEGASCLQQFSDCVWGGIADFVVSRSFAADLGVEVPDGDAVLSHLLDSLVVGGGGVCYDSAVLEDSPEPVLGVGVVLLLLQRLDAGEGAEDQGVDLVVGEDWG